MPNVYADCNKISNTISVIDELNNDTSNTNNLLDEDIESIISVGNNHDNCFSGISASMLTSKIDDTTKEINKLKTNMVDVIHSVVEYSCDSSKKEVFVLDKKVSDIKVDGLAQAIICDLNNTSYDQLQSKYKRASITEGYDYEYYNKILKEISDSSTTQRERITATAIFLATYFPQLPYFWGGGHQYDVEGVDPNWGKPATVTEEGSSTTGSVLPYSIDCSGYVDWVLYNSGYDKSKVNANMTDTALMQNVEGTTESLTAENVFQRVQPGDIAHMDGHIGMVVRVDGTKVTVAHCSGSGEGMNLTTIDTVSGTASNGTTYDAGVVVADSNKQSRLYTQYFTEVREATYEGE